MRVSVVVMGLLMAVGLGGCTHLKGVVLEDPSGRPMRTAVLSVGRPGGIAVYETHAVDEKGAFDFSVMPMDANNVYLYDSGGDPQTTVRHVDESEMSEHMQLHMRRASPPNLMVPTNLNIDQ